MSWNCEPFLFQQHLFKCLHTITGGLHTSHRARPQRATIRRDDSMGTCVIAYATSAMGTPGSRWMASRTSYMSGETRAEWPASLYGLRNPHPRVQISLRIRSHMPGHKQEEGQEIQSLFLEWLLLTSYGSRRRGRRARGNGSGCAGCTGEVWLSKEVGREVH